MFNEQTELKRECLVLVENSRGNTQEFVHGWQTIGYETHRSVRVEGIIFCESWGLNCQSEQVTSQPYDVRLRVVCKDGCLDEDIGTPCEGGPADTCWLFGIKRASFCNLELLLTVSNAVQWCITIQRLRLRELGDHENGQKLERIDHQVAASHSFGTRPRRGNSSLSDLRMS